MAQTILVVDDDRKTVDLIRLYLEHEGYQVRAAYDGQAALAAVRRERPSLVVLDLMLPRLSGLDVCSALRAEGDLPVIMLTARAGEEDRLTGLDLGADDYVVKPFSPRELVARVRTVLRRAGQEETRRVPAVQFGDVTVNFVRYEACRGGAPVRLTPTEFRLLRTLVSEPGRVFTRFELLERLGGIDSDALERTVDVHLKNLRQKIEPDPRRPRYVVTVLGIGYKFAEDVHAVQDTPASLSPVPASAASSGA